MGKEGGSMVSEPLAQKRKEPIVKLTDKELEVLISLLPKDLQVSKDQINKDSKETKRVGNSLFLVFNEPSIRNEFIEQIKYNNDLRLAKGFPQISSTNLEDIEWFKNGVKLNVTQLKEATKSSESYLNSLNVKLEEKETPECLVSSKTVEIQTALQDQVTSYTKLIGKAREMAKETDTFKLEKLKKEFKTLSDRVIALSKIYIDEVKLIGSASAEIEEMNKTMTLAAEMAKRAQQSTSLLMSGKMKELQTKTEENTAMLLSLITSQITSMAKEVAGNHVSQSYQLTAESMWTSIQPNLVLPKRVEVNYDEKMMKLTLKYIGAVVQVTPKPVETKLTLADFLNMHGLKSTDKIVLTETLTNQLHVLEWLQDRLDFVENGKETIIAISNVKPPLPEAFNKKCYAAYTSKDKSIFVIAIAPAESQLFVFKE